MSRPVSVPVYCRRCLQRLGESCGVSFSVVCTDCADKPLEARVTELEERIKAMERRIDDRG